MGHRIVSRRLLFWKLFMLALPLGLSFLSSLLLLSLIHLSLSHSPPISRYFFLTLSACHLAQRGSADRTVI